MAQFFRNWAGQANGSSPYNATFPYYTPTTAQINTTAFAFPVYQETHSINNEHPLIFNEVPAASTIEIVAKVRMDTVTPGTTNDYQADLVLRGSGGPTSRNAYTVNFLRGQFINVEGYQSNTSFTIGSGSNYSFSANTWYWIRAKVVGNVVSYRVWLDGSTEPTGWDTATDASSRITGNGWAGIGAWKGVGTRYWAQVGIGTDGDPAPTSPVDNALTVATESVATSEDVPTLTVPTSPLADVGGAIYAPFGGFIPGISGFGLGYRIGSTPIAPSDMSVGVVNEAPTTIQDYLMALNALGVAVGMDNIATIYNSPISPNDLSVANSLSVPAIIQDFNMSVDPIAVTSYIEALAELGFELIAGAEALYPHVSMDNIDLNQLYTLTPQNLSTTPFLEVAGITEDRTLAMADMLLQTTTSMADIIQDYVMALQNLVVNTTADNIALVQAYALAVESLYVGITTDNLYVFSPLIIANLNVGTVVEHIERVLDLYISTFNPKGDIESVDTTESGIIIPNIPNKGVFESVEVENSGLLIPQIIQQKGKY